MTAASALRSLFVLLACASVQVAHASPADPEPRAAADATTQAVPPSQPQALVTVEVAPSYDDLVRQGIESHETGAFADAHAFLEQAHALAPNARTLRGMGVASFRGGFFARAVRELRAALTHPNKPLEAELRSGAEDVLKRAEAEVLLLSLSVTPGNATVAIDGTEPAHDFDLVLEPGSHTLRVVAEGYAERVISVYALRGFRDRMRVDLLPNASSLPAPGPTSATESSLIPREPPATVWHSHRFRMVTAWSAASLALASTATAVGLFMGAKERVDDIARACASHEAGGCSVAERDQRAQRKHLPAFERGISASIGIAAITAGTAIGMLTWDYLDNGRRIDLRVSATSVSYSQHF